MVNSLGCIILLLAISCVTHGAEWSELRTHYSLDPTKGFFKMPRTTTEADSDNWRKINQECFSSGDNSTFAGFRYEDPEDDGVVLIFDVNGIIAGIQARLPHVDMLPETPVNPFRFEKVPLFNNITENGKTYFILTGYFVDPEIICTTGRTETDLEIEGTGTGVFLQNGPSPQHLRAIPKYREDAINAGWSDNNCWPGMGLHNFYEVHDYETHNCTEAQPSFALYDKGSKQLYGFGFSTTGTSAASKYFEHPPSFFRKVILGSPFPSCVIPTNDLMGSTALHVYFTKEPWLHQC